MQSPAVLLYIPQTESLVDEETDAADELKTIRRSIIERASMLPDTVMVVAPDITAKIRIHPADSMKWERIINRIEKLVFEYEHALFRHNIEIEQPLMLEFDTEPSISYGTK